METMTRRPLWAEIDLDALAGNVRELRRIVGPKVLLTAAVKADAYGCGAAMVAAEALRCGIDRLAVAVLDEAVELRQAGITAPILILGNTAGARAAELVVYGVDACVYRLEDAEAFSAEAVRQHRQVRLHISIDSGMGRIGYRPDEDSVAEIKKISALPGVVMEGIITHFCTADFADKTFTHEQYRRFDWICSRLVEEGVHINVQHCCSSAATLALPEYHCGMVRPGIVLYGVAPSDDVGIDGLAFKPMMSLKCHITHVKTIEQGDSVSYGRHFIAAGPTKIATLPLGYADGYARLLSNRAKVLVHGVRVPQVGNICMDQCMVDVSSVPDVAVGDEVVLFGTQGGQTILVDELAKLAETIPHEIMCAVARRVPRVYMRGGREVARREYLFD